MADNINVTEKDGKKYFVFADSTEALIENDIINNLEWVDIKTTALVYGGSGFSFFVSLYDSARTHFIKKS